MSWRDHCKKVIEAVFNAHPALSHTEARKVLRAAYPFGDRACWPYKVWCHEVRRQLAARYGTLPPPPMRSRSKRAPLSHEQQLERAQLDLFAL